MSSRRILLAITLVFPATSATPAAPARAAAGTPCTFEHTVYLSPGLTTFPSSGTVASKAQHGSTTCHGPVNGKQPSGPGTLSANGRYGTDDGDTCQTGGEGEDVQSIIIPTSDGAERVDNNVRFVYGAFKAGSPFSGTFRGERMSGTFDAQPMAGDCVSEPVTKLHVTGKGTLNS